MYIVQKPVKRPDPSAGEAGGDHPVGHVGQVQVKAVLLVPGKPWWVNLFLGNHVGSSPSLVLGDELPGTGLEVLLLREDPDDPDDPHTSEHREQGKVLKGRPPAAQGHAGDDEGGEDDGEIEGVVPVDEEDLGGEDQQAGDHFHHEVDGEDKIGHFQPICV